MTKDDVIFVSFYTATSEPFPRQVARKLKQMGITRDEFSYAAHAKLLIESLEKYGLHHDIEKIKDMRWQAAVRSKPAFIQKMMKKHEAKFKAIIWVDADSYFAKSPYELWHIRGDIACRVVKRPRGHPRPRTTEVHMGLLYVANTVRMRTLVEEWVERMDGIPPTERCPEQEALYALLLERRGSVRWVDLPDRFAQAVGWGHQFAVCVQFQQSRYEREVEKLVGHLDTVDRIKPHDWPRDPRLHPPPPRGAEETRKLRAWGRAKRKKGVRGGNP